MIDKIRLNHWFIENNTLSISLMDYHVSISLKNNLWETIVTDSYMNKTTYYFNTLQEAINYVENDLNNKNNRERLL